VASDFKQQATTCGRYTRGVFARLVGLLALLSLSSCALFENQEASGVAIPTVASSNQETAVLPTIETQPLVVNLSQSVPPAPEAYIQRGSGRFIGSTAASAGAGGEIPLPAENEYTLNFLNVDIRDVVRTVLGEFLHLTHSVAPSVQGAVTFQASRPLNAEQTLEALEQVLRLNGVALVRSGEGYAVLPAAEAAGHGLPLAAEGEVGVGAAVRIIPLRFVAAQQVSEVLQSVTPVGGGVRVDPEANLIVAWGSQRDLASVAEFVSILDVNWLAGMSFGLFPLNAANAADVVTELEEIFAGASGGKISDLAKFSAIERLNAVLVIARQPRYLDEARSWIGRLDRVTHAERDIRVYRIENRRAIDIGRIMQQLLSQPSAVPPTSEGSLLAPGLEASVVSTDSTADGIGETTDLSDTSLFGETSDLGTAQRGLSSRPGRSAFESDIFESETRRRAKPAEIENFTAVTPTGEDIRIVADDSANALVVLASAEGHGMVEAALRQLDTLPLQVMIEATIAEVVLTDELRYGVRFFLESGNHAATFSDDILGRIAPVFPGFSYLFASTNARIALSALKDVTNVKVLSAPSLLVLDNQTALLQVGDEVPVATQSAVSVLDPEAPIVNSIEFRDTGVILKITPRVNSGGLVLLDVNQEVSDVAETTTSGIDSPTIQQRRIKSTVSVQSGETVALGGLIRDRAEKGKTGIPLLSDIPIIGNAFAENTQQGARTELIVLLRPVVIQGPGEARAATDELRRKLRGLNSFEANAVAPTSTSP
jgi:general secretion pathway protein D